MSRKTHVDWSKVYQEKLRPAAEAASLVRPTDLVAAPIATGQPSAFLSALGERDDFEDLMLFSGLLTEPYALLKNPRVKLISGFFGPVERMMKADGANVEYLPADFLGWERYARLAAPRVVASALAPMDERGFLSFGLHSGATFEAFRDAARDPNRVAIGEIVKDMPHIFGLGRFGGNRVHISELDCVIESDRSAFVLPAAPPDDADRAIAHHVEELIDDGSTLQIGIGAIPNVVAQLLAEGSKGDFGIHTEMLVDGVMHLHQHGKVTNHKGIFDGFSIATFGAGSRELYEWADRNPEVRMLPVMQVNDPAIIRCNRSMVSINGALSVDMAGQIMADTIGPRQYSGVGGHELFVMGSHDSHGGKSIICLHSTAKVRGETVSTIVADLPLGTRVTTPRHHVQYIVTEHGAANVGMMTDEQRSLALAEIAHPDFRAELEEAAARKRS